MVSDSYLERLINRWLSDPQGRVRLFVIVNLIALAMLLGGVVIIVLILGGYLERP